MPPAEAPTSTELPHSMDGKLPTKLQSSDEILAKKDRLESFDSIDYPEYEHDKLLGDDVEKQEYPGQSSPQDMKDGAEYAVSLRKKMAFLAMYFTLNLGLTLYNKAVLGKFEFPWLLTAIHATSAFGGCSAVMVVRPKMLRLSRLGHQEHFVLCMFSLLFTVNIAISNVSLAMVSVPFHQIVRSTTPLATVALYRLLGRTYSTSTYLALVPIILGVGLSTFGQYQATILGSALTFLGVILAALKTLATNRLLTGSLALPPLEMLFRMSPLAALQALMYSYASGELSQFMAFVKEGSLSTPIMMVLFGNGLLACLLNITSFTTNKAVGALTLTVCGNIKQCLTVLLGVVLWKVHVDLLNGSGMVIALIGAAWYSKVEIAAKGRGK